MKIKTSELTGAALDRAVGMALQLPASYWNEGKCAAFSTDWSHGGPIIERERIGVEPWGGDAFWVSMTYSETGMTLQKKFGQTPLIAAMRCYVASKLGDEVEIPAELS